jgi:hypothetical protein
MSGNSLLLASTPPSRHMRPYSLGPLSLALGKSLYIIHAPKEREPINVATSRPIPDRPIGRADGPNLTIPGHLKKNPRLL